MLSESWLKDKHPCLVFCRSIRRRQRVSKEKADDDQDQVSETLIAKMCGLEIAL